MPVRQLRDVVINQIAAGEVVDRPASVVKELVENALDSNAKKIEIIILEGGRRLIQVYDDGHGMDPDDLNLCVERHATSKIQSEDLFRIETLGFRGEALPSIGSVAKLEIVSRVAGADNAWRIAVSNSVKSDLRPAPLSFGTCVDVHDLFSKVPARLKFLKSDRAENMAITDLVRRLSMAYPCVGFKLSIDGQELLNLKPESLDLSPRSRLLSRVTAVMGSNFSENAIFVEGKRGGNSIEGYISLPTLHKANAAMQYLFVNGRFVRDKMIQGAVRSAYADVLVRDRHPLFALFLSVDPGDVDVNVHPAKAEVRFRDGNLVRSLIVNALKQGLNSEAGRSSSSGGAAAVSTFRPEMSSFSRSASMSPGRYYYPSVYGFGKSALLQEDIVVPAGLAEASRGNGSASDGWSVVQEKQDFIPDRPLGIAKSQLHGNYIITQTADGMIIVDQHAAHERLVYEGLKAQRESGSVARQPLLIPEVVTLDRHSVSRITNYAHRLEALGLVLDGFGTDAVVVREVPALLGNPDIGRLVRDIADDLEDAETTDRLERQINHILATMACHGSVRSGRVLDHAEMEALLRQMEETALSGQCNHGRPTYIELKLHDIERLFGRH